MIHVVALILSLAGPRLSTAVPCGTGPVRSPVTQACALKCQANGCPDVHPDDATFRCEDFCREQAATRVGADVLFGCAKGVAWDLPISLITTPVAMLSAVIDSARDGQHFAEWCEGAPPAECKNALARDAAYFTRGHLGQNAELKDVYVQDLIRKRAQVRSMAARDATYRAWLVEHGVSPEASGANETAADLVFNYVTTQLGRRWTCSSPSERAALVCQTVASTLLAAKGLAPISEASPLGTRVAAARKLYERGRNELNRTGELSDVEKARLATAHAIGDARVGEYPRPEIIAKYRELRKTFRPDEAKRLLKRGVAGNIDDASLAAADRLDALVANQTAVRDPAQLRSGLGAFVEVARDPEARALIEPSADSMSVTHNLDVIRTMPPENLANARQVSGGLKLTKDELLKKGGDYLIFYHGTSDASARAVASKVNLGAGDGEFGPGFYLTSSRTQAQDWANATSSTRGANSGKPTVLTYVFKRADLQKIIGAQSQLALEKGNAVFDRFVQMNKSYRKAELPPLDNPSIGIGVIYGPSVSAAKGVFNQIKFSPNDVNAGLFAPGSPSVAVFADQ